MSLLMISHCVESVRFRSYSGPYSVQIRENTDQNNSEYRHFSGSFREDGIFLTLLQFN